LLGSWIKFEDPTLLVNRDDGIEGGLQDHSFAGLTCPHGLLCLLAFSDIQIERQSSGAPTFYHHRNTQGFQIPVPPPGHHMNDLSFLDTEKVVDDLGIILWTAHHFNQVAPDDFGLSAGEHLLKGGVAGHNLVIKVSTDDSDGAIV